MQYHNSVDAKALNSEGRQGLFFKQCVQQVFYTGRQAFNQHAGGYRVLKTIFFLDSSKNVCLANSQRRDTTPGRVEGGGQE